MGGSPPLQHEDAPSAKLQGEVLAVEEERAQVLGRVEQLKVRVKELEQQLQEAAREVSCLGGPQALGCGAPPCVPCLDEGPGVCV